MQSFSEILKDKDNLLGIIVRVIIVLAITYVIATIIKKIWKKNDKFASKIYYRFLYNIIVILVYLVGFFVALSQTPSLNKALATLLAGSGIAALAIGLAAQESLGNLINGIVMTIAKPFEVGDRIHLINGKITGYVEDITLRHTVIRTFVNTRIIIPNSTINKDMIENSNYEGAIASSFVDVTITYDSNMHKAAEIMAKAIGNHPEYLDTRSDQEKKDPSSPKVKVYVRELGLNGVILRASMWTKDIDSNFPACSDVRYKIKDEFEQNSIVITQIPARTAEPLYNYDEGSIEK